MNEYQMQMEVFRRLQCSPQIEAVGREVCFGGQHWADICAIIDGRLIAYELKLVYCERAIQQAENYLEWGADRAYVVTPKKRITRKARERFIQSGIGLLLFIESQDERKKIGNTIVPVQTDFSWPLEEVIAATREGTADSESPRWRDGVMGMVRWEYGEFIKHARRAIDSRDGDPD